MGWSPLARFRDRGVPKLWNLRRAERKGIRVPPTWWMAAGAARGTGAAAEPEAALGPAPWIVRSAAASEDGPRGSNAGRFLSLPVRDRAAFAEALGDVAASVPEGCVFVQPLVEAPETGVAFFDGFYFERTASAGSNEALTSGRSRGEARRGHLARGDPWSIWLERLHALFRFPVLDIEYARDASGYLLLQARPALFPVRRNYTLSLSNHRETLGEIPSAWVASILAAGGHEGILRYFGRLDPEIGTWGEPYAVVLGGRAWMNLSFFWRILDRFGIPRTAVTRGIGGPGPAAADARPIGGRLLRSLPRLLRAIPGDLVAIASAPRTIARHRARFRAATTLLGIWEENRRAVAEAFRIIFAVGAPIPALAAIRRALRIPEGGRPVTREMMDAFERIRGIRDPERRALALDAWLGRYGHRGPAESDPAEPRFRELRETLLQSLAVPPAAPPPARASRGWRRLLRPLFLFDERREWLRDQMMRGWEQVRARLLEEGRRLAETGALDRPDDVFWLTGENLRGERPLRDAARDNRARAEAHRATPLPMTASLDEIEGILRGTEARTAPAGARRFHGIPLHAGVFEGRAVVAAGLLGLLRAAAERPALLGPDAILVAPALEPAWGVVFPRVGGVVAEAGGELSHASILLREARKPAVVSCEGICRRVRDGERLRLDGPLGIVEVLG